MQIAYMQILFSRRGWPEGGTGAFAPVRPKGHFFGTPETFLECPAAVQGHRDGGHFGGHKPKSVRFGGPSSKREKFGLQKSIFFTRFGGHGLWPPSGPPLVPPYRVRHLSE